LAVPTIPRILTGMIVARIAGAMVAVAIVLFTLAEYQSAELAGLVTFVAIMPGLLVSPIAGALLDRHGRTRLVVLDYAVGAISMALIGGLALAGDLPAWLLVVIAGVSSLTQPLSNTGLRSLFPIIVPPPLWGRVNAMDSNGYLVSTLVGPPIAAILVQVIGGPETLMIIGVMYAVAAVILLGVHDPTGAPTSPGTSILRDAWAGVVYVWRNRTMRGLAFTMSTLNIGTGVLTIAIPIIVITRLHESPALVGVAWSVAGACGIVTGLWFGRLNSHGREKRWLVWSTFGYAISMALLLVNYSVPILLLSMAIGGLLNGPMDIALFTIRQRRVDPAWLGRAIAVSASLNFSGYPIGSAISGALVEKSLELTILVGVGAALLAGFFGWWQIPRDADETAGAPLDEASLRATG
jgi:MFS family permease